jgi:hypothetical protein
LTFSGEEVPSRLKTISIDDSRFLILFEVWDSNGYLYTAYKISDEDEMVKICHPIRLHRSMPLIQGDTIKMLASYSETELAVYEFKF